MAIIDKIDPVFNIEYSLNNSLFGLIYECDSKLPFSGIMKVEIDAFRKSRS